MDELDVIREKIQDAYYRQPIFYSQEESGRPVQEWEALAYARGLIREIELVVGK